MARITSHSLAISLLMQIPECTTINTNKIQQQRGYINNDCLRASLNAHTEIYSDAMRLLFFLLLMVQTVLYAQHSAPAYTTLCVHLAMPYCAAPLSQLGHCFGICFYCFSTLSVLLQTFISVLLISFSPSRSFFKSFIWFRWCVPVKWLLFFF